MKILLPVDGSEQALRAVEYVIGLRDAGVSVSTHLLNVQPGLPADISRFVAREDIVGFHQEQGDAHLDAPAARLEEAGIDVAREVATGNSAQVICDHADSLGCACIVMGSRGHGGVMGMLLGSTAQRVTHLAKVPVTLVP